MQNSQFFYSKFIYKREALEPIIDKALKSLGTAERAAQAVETQRLTKEQLEKITSRAKEAQKKGKGEEVKKFQLLRRYVFLNNPKGTIETPKVSPKYLALERFKDRTHAREAFMMLSLVEKYWSIDKARELYDKAYNGDTYDMDVLYSFFSEKNVAKKLGFYYGSNRKSYSWVKSRGKKLKVNDPWYHEMRVGDSPYASLIKDTSQGFYWNRKYHVTGWWTVDTNGEDEFSYSKTLAGAMGKLHKELIDDPEDSGLPVEHRGGKVVSPYGEELVAYIKKSKEDGESFDRDRKIKLYEYFHKHPQKRYHDKWNTLEDSEAAGQMVACLGQGWENYLLRYSQKDKKIYYVSIQGKTLKPEWGYISIMENKYKKGSWMVDTYVDKSNDLEFLKREIIDKMPASQVNAELSRIEQKTTPVVKGKEIDKTVGACADIFKTPNVYKVQTYFPYDQREKMFFEPLAAGLLTWVKANVAEAKNNEDLAKKLVDVRMAKVRADFGAAKTANGALDNALNSNEKTKVKIEFADNDVVKLDFHDTSLAGRAAQEYQQVLKEKTKQAKKAMEEQRKAGFVGRITEGLNRFFDSIGGPFKRFGKMISGFLASALSDMFDPATLAKLPLIGGFLGGSLAAVGLLKMRKKDFEKLTKGKTQYKFGKGYTIAENEYDLGNGKIVLPDGKEVKGKLKKGFKIPKGSEWRAA